MNATAELKALEERAYKQTWNDGILDLIIGIGLVMLGLLFRTDLAGLAGMFVAVLLMPFWAVGKQLITVPRLGYAEFSEDRKATERGWQRHLLVLGVMTLALAVGLYVATTTGRLGDELGEIRLGYLLFGGLIALGLGAAGFIAGLPRLTAYAAVVLAATGIGYVTGLELEDYVLAAGIVILAVGVVVFARFIRRHPRRDEVGR